MTGEPPPLLIRRAELDGHEVDVRVAGGRIDAIGTHIAHHGDRVIDAAGGAILPGLHDHHIHLMSLAASAASVQVGPPDVLDAGGLAQALRSAPHAGTGGWVRAVGYHGSVAGDLDRAALDALVPDRPARVQHRGGALWMLNSLGLRAAGVDGCRLDGVERDAAGHPTGRLWRLDGWLRDAVPPVPVDLAEVGRAGAAAGVTGFTDATPDRSAEHSHALAAAGLPQRLVLMRSSSGGGKAAPRTAPPPGTAWGPVKLMLDDDTIPSIGDLAARIRAAHDAGLPVAVHCVTRLQLVVTLAALAEAGPPHRGDRIEHAAVVPSDLRGALRERAVTVVTQPNFVAERGDRYMADVDAGDLPLLYPAASLAGGEIPIAAGTDAPFGRPDPWAAIRAAIDRRTAAGTVLGADERLTPRAALALFLGGPDEPGRPRTVRPGVAADLCLLRLPLDEALRDPSAGNVALTVIGGALVGSAFYDGP